MSEWLRIRFNDSTRHDLITKLINNSRTHQMLSCRKIATVKFRSELIKQQTLLHYMKRKKDFSISDVNTSRKQASILYRRSRPRAFRIDIKFLYMSRKFQ